mgnify:CR=1 FL=1
MCVEPPLGELKPAPMEPLKIKEIYQPVDVREVETGVWQYDLGKKFFRVGKDFPENRWQQSRTEGGAEKLQKKLDEKRTD